MKNLRYKNYLLAFTVSFVLNALFINIDDLLISSDDFIYIRIAMSLLSLLGIIIYPIVTKSYFYYNISIFTFATILCFLVGLLDIISGSSSNGYYVGIIQILLMIIMLNPSIKTLMFILPFSIIPYLILLNIYSINKYHNIGTSIGMTFFGVLYGLVVRQLYQLQNEIIDKADEKSNILESINEAFISLNLDKEIIYINDNAKKIIQELGYPTDTTTGNKINILFPELINADLNLRIEKCILNESPENYIQYFPNLKMHFAIRINKHNQYISLFMLDITEIETKQNTIEKKLEQKVIAIKKVIHDIRTPLQGIDFNSHFIEKLNQLFDSEKLAKYAERIKESSYIINELLKDLEEPEIANIGSTKIKDIYYQIFDTIINNNVAFAYNEIFDATVYGDKIDTYKVLSNIVNNAIKYTTDNFIKIESSINDTTLTVDISNKTSLKNADETIFNEFHRYANVMDTEGKGLGLSICKNIMHKLKGSVTYELNEDRISFIVNFLIIGESE